MEEAIPQIGEWFSRLMIAANGKTIPLLEDHSEDESSEEFHERRGSQKQNSQQPANNQATQQTSIRRQAEKLFAFFLRAVKREVGWRQAYNDEKPSVTETDPAGKAVATLGNLSADPPWA